MKSKKLIIGFAYNEKRILPGVDPSTDEEAEFDSPKTLESIRQALRNLGHQVIDLEAVPQLPRILSETKVDIVFNIAEGIKGRNREVQIPALLELLQIPYTGSDPTTLALALDKGLAKRIVASQGVATAPFQLFHTGKEKLNQDLTFPLVLKPVAEGSSKGVLKNSVVNNENELREIAHFLIKKHRQPVIGEEFLVGREFTVGLLGSNKKPKPFFPMEIVFSEKAGKFPIYTYQHKLDTNDEVHYNTSPKLSTKERESIEKVAIQSFKALGCRDVARIDIRMNSKNEPCFIECNPLPGLTPKWSDLCIIAEAAGLAYDDLIKEILTQALKRVEKENS